MQRKKSHKSLALYYFEDCPFCRKVQVFMNKKGIRIPMRNIITEPGAYEELAMAGGRTQVPCLVVNGRAIYESEDIIKWFKKNGKG